MEVQNCQNADELVHFGIKGQKWGVRRFQNEDGSYTEEGIRRYQKKYPYQNPDGSLTEKGKKDFMKAARKGQLDYRHLSDKDLDMINNRFNKEAQYKRNVEDYEKSTFQYKLKEAVVNRVSGGGGGGKGKGKGGGSGIGKLLATPIKKALEDAMKFDANKGGGDKSSYDENDRKAQEWGKNGHRVVDNYVDKAKWPDVDRGKNHFEKAMREFSTNSSSGGRMGTYDSSPTSYMEERLRKNREAKAAQEKAKRERELQRDAEGERQRQRDEEKAKKLRYTKNGWMYMSDNNNIDVLIHHGIKGQKWGVRRFQNEDRTLTAAGKERYGNGSQETKRGRTKDLVGRSTNIEAEYANSCGTVSQDPKVRRQLDSIISNSSDPAVKKAVEHANEWKIASEKLNNAFSTFSARLRKDRGGKEWEGDGTEEHWEMEKRYPEYRDVSRNEQIALKNLVESSISLSKSKEFSNVKGFEKSKNYFDSYPEYGNWFKKGDQRAYAIAMTLLGGRDTNKYFEVWPEYFIESFDGSGNKIDTRMFDIK